MVAEEFFKPGETNPAGFSGIDAQFLLDNVDILMWVIAEKEGELYYEVVNQAFARFHGVDVDQYTGKSLKAIHLPQRYQKIKETFDWVKLGKTHTTEETWGGKDNPTYFLVRLNPLPSTEGSNRVIASAIDISGRKKVDSELQRHTRTIEALYEWVREINHAADLKAVISGSVEFLLNNPEVIAGGIYMLSGDELILEQAFGSWKVMFERYSHLSIEDSYWSKVCKAHGTVVFEEFSGRSELLSAEEVEAGIGKMLAVMVRYGGETLGGVAMVLRSKEVDYYSRSFLELVASELGTAVLRKLTERELRDSEDRYRVFTEEALVGVYIYGGSGKFLFVNKAMEEITGYSREELLELDPWSIILPEDMQDVIGAREALKRQGEKLEPQYVMRINRKNGEVAYLELRIREVQYESKSAQLGNCIDITARIRAEAELKHHRDHLEELVSERTSELSVSEERFRQLAENIHEVFWLTDWVNNKILYISPAYEKIWGKTCDSLYEDVKSWAYDIHSDDHDRITKSFKENAAAGSYDEVYRIVRPDGETRWIHDRAFPIHDQKGGVWRVAGVSEDITDVKRIEEALRESGEHYRRMIDSIGDAIHVVDPGLRILLFNPTFAEWNKRLNLELDVIGKTIFEVFPFLTDKIREEYVQVFSTAQTLVTEEQTRIDDELYVTETRKIPIIEESQVKRVLTIIHDITKRKQIEKRIIRERKVFALMAEAAIHASDIPDVCRRVLDGLVSTLGFDFGVVRILEDEMLDPVAVVGMPVEEAEMKVIPVSIDDPHLIASLVARTRKAIFAPDISSHEILKTHRDRITEMDVISLISWPITGTADILLGVLHLGARERKDIPEEDRIFFETVAEMLATILERKQADIALRESEERWRSLARNAPAFITIVNPDHVIQYINRTVPGLSVDEVTGKSVYDFVELKYHEEARGKIEAVFRSGEPGFFLSSAAGPHGDMAWYENYLGPIKIGEEVVAVTIIALDITEKKRAELELMESEEKYRNVVERASDGIVILQDGKIMYVNPQLACISGYTLEELRGKQFAEMIHPDEIEKVTGYYERRMAGQDAPTVYETAFIDKEGQVVEIEVNVGHITYQSRPAELVFVRDIAQRKRLELRREVKTRLLDCLRESKSIEQCLQLGCDAVKDAGLFKRGVLVLQNEKGQIIHLGQIGLYPEVVAQIRKVESPDKQPFEQMLTDEFKISHSYFVPREAGVDFSATKRYIPQEGQPPRGSAETWQSGDELFVPVFGPDGETRSYLSVDTPIDGKRPDTETIIYLEDIVDIVFRQVRELQNVQALRAAEREKSAILTSMSEHVVYQNTEMEILWANKAAADSLGLEPHQLVGQRCYELWYGRKKPCESCPVKNARGTGENHEEEMKTPDGRVWFVRGHPVKDEEGKVIAMVEVSRDITARKNAEEALKKAHDELEVRVKERTTELAITNTQLLKEIAEREQQERLRQVRAQLLDELRVTESINEALQLGCEAVRDAGLFKRAVFSTKDEKGVVTNIGFVGMDSETIADAMNQPVPAPRVFREILRSEFRISHSYFIPVEAGIDISKTGRYIIQDDEALDDSFDAWKRGDELFIPMFGLARKEESYLSVDTPFSTKRPDIATILYLEDIVDIVGRQIHQIENLKALQESEERYRVLTQEAMVGVYISVGRRFLFVNPAMERITGYSNEELLAIDTHNLIFYDDIKMISNRKGERESDQTDQYTMRIYRKNGEIAYLEVKVRPIVYSGHVAFLGNCVDSTQLILQGKRVEQAKQAWEGTFDSISDLVMILDSEYRIMRANRAVADYTGEDFDSLLSMEYLDVFHLGKESNQSLLFEADKHPEHFELNDPVTGRVFSVSASPLLDQLGEPVASVHVARDISDMRQIEQALTESEAQFRGLAESVKDIIFSVTLDGRVKYINSAVKEILGVDPAAIIGSDLDQTIFTSRLLTDEARERLLKDVDAHLDRGHDPFFETEFEDIKGRKHVLEVAARRYANQIVGVARDVTERKRMERQLIQASKLVSIGILAAGIAHQVNNPLAIMLSTSTVLRDMLEDEMTEEAKDEITRYLDMLEEQIERTKSVVSGLLEFAQPKQIQIQSVDVNYLINEALAFVSQHLNLDNLEIEVDEAGELPEAMVDPVGLQQVLINVIQNAFEAMNGEGRIILKTIKPDGDYIHITISDTGPGIPETIRNEVFEPLFTTKTKKKGTGLGLPVCVMLLDRFGGRIHLEDRQGPGATFVIEVPTIRKEHDE